MTSFLIVDDSMVIRTVLRYMLERWGGAVVGEATVSLDAVIKLINELNPDAITLSVSLRGEADATLLSAIKRLPWSGKIFFLANEEQAGLNISAEGLGVDGLLLKPLTLGQLSSELDRVLK